MTSPVSEREEAERMRLREVSLKYKLSEAAVAEATGRQFCLQSVHCCVGRENHVSKLFSLLKIKISLQKKKFLHFTKKIHPVDN